MAELVEPGVHGGVEAEVVQESRSGAEGAEGALAPPPYPDGVLGGRFGVVLSQLVHGGFRLGVGIALKEEHGEEDHGAYEGAAED